MYSNVYMCIQIQLQYVYNKCYIVNSRLGSISYTIVVNITNKDTLSIDYLDLIQVVKKKLCAQT